MSKAEFNGGIAKCAPPTATHVLSSSFVAAAPPVGASPRILAELRGDDLLSSGSMDEAITAYRLSKSTSWRVREKIGVCYYMLQRWEECARALEGAPARREAFCNMLLLESLSLMFHERPDRSTIRQMEAAALVLVSLPSPTAREFELANWCIDDETLRGNAAAKAFVLYPDDRQIRRNYIKSLQRLGKSTKDELFALAAHGASGTGATLQDLWLAFNLTCGPNRCYLAMDYLAKIEDFIGSKLPALDLARGDTLLLADDLPGARTAYAKAWAGLEPLRENHAAILGAIRGLLVVAAKTCEKADAVLFAQKLVDRFSDFPDAFFSQSSILEGELFAIQLDDHPEWYLPAADLFSYRGFLLNAIESDELRGVLRVAFADYDGPRFELTADEKSTELWHAANETESPAVARILGWHFLREGEEPAAGALFVRYELARSGGGGEPIDDSSMFDEIEGDAAPDISDFARGMLDELAKFTVSAPTAVAQRGHALIAAFVRKALLDQKEYELLEQLTGCVATAASAYDTPASAYFDHGLALHYLQKKGEAVESYRRCLELEPGHSSAMANMLMLVPKAEKERLVLKKALLEYPDITDQFGLEDLSFENAVYLLSLVRACDGLEQGLVLRPFGEGEHPFAPSRDNLQPLFHLLECGLVKISAESPVTAFDIDIDKQVVVAYRFSQVFWELPPVVLTLMRRIEDTALTGAWPATWRVQAPELARKIARGECLAYLEHVANERFLGVPAGEKTCMMIDNVLTTHSVSQAFGILWKAATGASDFKQRKSVTPQHAGNTIVGNAQRYVDLARAEGYDLKQYSRPKNLPRSHLSHTLHDTFLRTGTRCFGEPLPELLAGAWPYGMTGTPQPKKANS